MKRFKRAQDIKVGVIGYGGAFNMGMTHLREMMRAKMTPIAVADIDRSRLSVAENDFPGIETYDSVSAMLRKSDVNLVTIVTPHNTHARLAIQCLNAGKSVCCEKPLAVTTAECDQMIAVARKNRLLLSTYHNRHWDGCILDAVKKVKKQRLIGDVVRVEAHGGGYGKPGRWWRSSKSISGGILYDWGVHMLEYGLQLIESDMKEVIGVCHKGFWGPKTAWKADTNEDEMYLLVRFASGQWMSLSITSIDSNPKSDRGMAEVTGTKGTYLMNVGGGWRLIRQVRGKQVITEGKNPPDQWWRFYQNIADHLAGKAKLIITPQWARRPIHILDLADQSAKKGRAMRAGYK